MAFLQFNEWPNASMQPILNFQTFPKLRKMSTMVILKLWKYEEYMRGRFKTRRTFLLSVVV